MCSSACPITGVEGFNIRRIERAVQLGVLDDLLQSPIPWLCTTCGRCETACPNGYKVMTTTRTLRRMMPPELTPPLAACRKACPAGMDAPRYIRMIAEGRFDAAYAVIRETAPLPGILGRVCAHPCEEQCRRAAVNEPISICTLKRFAADQAGGEFPPVATASRHRSQCGRGGLRARRSHGRLLPAQEGPRRHPAGSPRAGRWHAALRHPGLSPAAGGARQGDRRHPGHGHRLPPRNRSGRADDHRAAAGRARRGAA